jgi:hypothetical protein
VIKGWRTGEVGAQGLCSEAGNERTTHLNGGQNMDVGLAGTAASRRSARGVGLFVWLWSAGECWGNSLRKGVDVTLVRRLGSAAILVVLSWGALPVDPVASAALPMGPCAFSQSGSTFTLTQNCTTAGFLMVCR